MNKAYILNRIQTTGKITMLFNNDDTWDTQLDTFDKLLEDNGYTIQSHKQVKAKIAFILHSHSGLGNRKVETYQLFDIAPDNTWSDAWLNYTHNLPVGYGLWLSHSCNTGIGCPKLLSLYVEFEINLPPY